MLQTKLNMRLLLLLCSVLSYRAPVCKPLANRLLALGGVDVHFY